MAPENKIRRIAVWVVSVLLTVVFLMAGAMKLLGKGAGMFEHWGYPAWFSYAIGAVEVVSAALLLIPKAASLGGAALAVMAIAYGSAAVSRSVMQSGVIISPTVARASEVTWKPEPRPTS